MANIKHGHASFRRGLRTSTYRAWEAARRRCRNPADKHYWNYGGRGIDMCQRWDLYENFLADMGVRPARLILDRIDNDRGYEPGNCRWVDAELSARNRRCVKLSESLAGEIRRRLNAGETGASVATSLGVSQSSVSLIKRNRIWKSEHSEPCGRLHKRRLLCAVAVALIRHISARGIRAPHIAWAFGVSDSAVSAIVRRERWPSIDWDEEIRRAA